MSKCIIHIGMHKTGSTSIQKSLDGFHDQNFFYAHLGNTPNHSLAIFSLFSSHPERHHLHLARGQDSAAIKMYLSRMKDDLESAIRQAAGRTLILSGEDIRTLSKNELEILYKYFTERFDDISIVGYIRPPAGFISSSFQQRVKSGALKEFNLSQQYLNYEKNFKKFDEVFGRENVHLWGFSPHEFPDGCVVRDFCKKLGIKLAKERIVRINESLSRQIVSLLYIYGKFTEKMGAKRMSGPDSQRLSEALGGLAAKKFRFSPRIIRPIIEENRKDIKWMEERLGCPLHEDLGLPMPDDIYEEADLLAPDREVVDKLVTLIDSMASVDEHGKRPEDVARLVHAFRLEDRRRRVFDRAASAGEPAGHAEGSLKSNSSLVIDIAELINQVALVKPQLLTGFSGNMAEELLRCLFKEVNHALTLENNAVVQLGGLGEFRVKELERVVDGEKSVRQVILFSKPSTKRNRKNHLDSSQPDHNERMGNV